jgi:hypothetical protein
LTPFDFLRGWLSVHNRFDQLVKRLVRMGLSPAGHVETEAEVTPDALRIDVWFVPSARRAPRVLAPLGLLGRMARTSCTLESYHCTPSGDQVADCIMKHRLFCRDLARRTPRPPLPMQWILSSGDPKAALAGFRFRPSRSRGIHDGPPLTWTKIVVISALPRTRDTLLVRLMGAGQTLQRAIADVRALPRDAPERRLALPILVRLRLEIPADQAKQTTTDREFLMITKEIDTYIEDLEEKMLQKGRREGRDEGFAQAVLAAYKARLGAPPPALVAAVERAGDLTALQRLLKMVTTLSAEEVAAALRKPRAKPAARAKVTAARSAGPAAAAHRR